MVYRNMASYLVYTQMVSPRFLILLSFLTFIVPIVWINSYQKDDNIVQEALENVARDVRYADVYRKANRQPRSLKYILLWTPSDYSPFYFFGSGQKAFLNNKCSVINCYVTANRNLFNGDITQFDAVAFNGRNMKTLRRSHLPNKRSPHQKYIFFNLESSDNYPLCQNMFDSFFNWTATYRLDSDVPYPYIVVKNKKGEVVGPRVDMTWDKTDDALDKHLLSKLQSKKKAAAWFVSHCSDRSGRRDYVMSLQNVLSTYGLSVDIYGSCGQFECPIDKKDECDLMLERDYYFYLAFENSFADDYVTEKLLTALQHNVVPVVYGSANYSRFLPPGSYLDARKESPDHLAAKMAHLISSPKLYAQFFNWRRHYDYSDATAVENVCSVCAALNDESFAETRTTYTRFREWWNPQYRDRCWWMEDDGMHDLWP